MSDTKRTRFHSSFLSSILTIQPVRKALLQYISVRELVSLYLCCKEARDTLLQTHLYEEPMVFNESQKDVHPDEVLMQFGAPKPRTIWDFAMHNVFLEESSQYYVYDPETFNGLFVIDDIPELQDIMPLLDEYIKERHKVLKTVDGNGMGLCAGCGEIHELHRVETPPRFEELDDPHIYIDHLTLMKPRFAFLDPNNTEYSPADWIPYMAFMSDLVTQAELRDKFMDCDMDTLLAMSDAGLPKGYSKPLDVALDTCWLTIDKIPARSMKCEWRFFNSMIYEWKGELMLETTPFFLETEDDTNEEGYVRAGYAFCTRAPFIFRVSNHDDDPNDYYVSLILLSNTKALMTAKGITKDILKSFKLSLETYVRSAAVLADYISVK